MKTEALNKFLGVLGEHLHGEKAMVEIDKIRHILDTRQDISGRVEALCRSFSLFFSLDPTLLSSAWQLRARVRPVCNEALFWSSEKKEILGALRALQASGTVDKVNACLIRSLLTRTYDLQRAARWSDVARSIAERSNRRTQISWSQCTSAVIRHMQGNDLRDKGNWRAAEAAYERATALWPKWSASWFGLGVIWMDQGKPHQALSAYKEGLKRDPGDWYGWSGIATAYLRLRNLEEAEKAARDGIKASREKGRLYYTLGCVQAARGEWFSAICSYCEALSLEREHADIWNHLNKIARK